MGPAIVCLFPQAHGNADGLSRLPLTAKTTVGNPEDITVFNVMQIQALPISAADIATATQKDLVLSKVLVCLRQGWPNQVQDALKPYWHRRYKLTIEQDTILWGMQVVVPSKLREQVLQELHQGHQGIARMKSLARSYTWWPKIDQDLERAKGCSACQENKNVPPKAPLNPWAWPERVWDCIHVDFAGPVRGKMLLIVVDSYSKWPEVPVMSSTSASKTVAVLREIFARNRIPRELVSDNGPKFVLQEFDQFLSNNGIRHIKTLPYHPASNGAAE